MTATCHSSDDKLMDALSDLARLVEDGVIDDLPRSRAVPLARVGSKQGTKRAHLPMSARERGMNEMANASWRRLVSRDLQKGRSSSWQGGMTEYLCRICRYPHTDDFRFVESDLCHVCHGPSQPTRHQLGEIARIGSRQGPVRVTRGRGFGQLELTFVEEPVAGFLVRPAVLTLDVRGRVVHRLEREVTPREHIAAQAA